MNIEYIGAGAGSGKTYTVTQRIGKALLNGDCEPAGLMATTYTRKAAHELRQRIRARLYEQGKPALAARMDEALIGTVHAVCARILQRHAFAAGISPQLEVMDETEAGIVLSQMADLAATEATTARLERLAESLNQRDNQTLKQSWPGQLKAVLAQVRANDFAVDTLPAMAEHTATGYLDLGGPEATDALDHELLASLDRSINSLPAEGDTTKTTANALRELERLREQQEAARLPWTAWIKLSKINVGKDSKPFVEDLLEVAARFPQHPRYRSDIRDYIGILFGLAKETLERFQAHKQERGLVDYSDLEQMTYHLLRDHADVRSACADELQMLVVDEFQDTSPLQMALFLQLAACANQTLWVGDVKQSIYGFRGSDPQLVEGAVRRLREQGNLGAPLSRSWRSVPELVHLTNELFVQPFAHSIGASPADVKLDPVRPPEKHKQPPLEILHASTGEFTQKGEPTKAKNETLFESIAQRISEILATQPPPQVGIKGTEGADEKTRDIQPGDIAVLCRTNTFAKNVAQALIRRGVAAGLSAPGLMDTPEVSLALACVRMLADRGDTLARAEILSWQGAQTLEQILADRITWLEETGDRPVDEWALGPESANGVLAALVAARGRMAVDSPSALLDQALSLGRVWETASRWGPDTTRAGQRRANLETLRGRCRQYEATCHSGHLPATVGGFLGWCDQLSADKQDNQATDPSPQAVQVTTYHGAKGLEWPIVICAQLDAETRDEWPNVQTVPTGNGTVDFDKPLADRTLHFWPAPFELKSNDFGHLTTIRNSEPVKRIRQRTENESLRLLYVGVTRARDRLILVTADKVQNTWLDSLGAEWLTTAENILRLPSGTSIPCQRHVVIPAEAPTHATTTGDSRWFPVVDAPSPKPAATRVPSGEAPIDTATIKDTVEYGERLPVNGTVDEASLGNALHAFLAFDLMNPENNARLEVSRRLLANHGLDDNLSAEDVVSCATRFRREIEERFQPKQIQVEVPFRHINASGQVITGFIDLLIETDQGWVVIDHKSFPGKKADWNDKALSYSGQLKAYQDALMPHGIVVAGTWIHLVVGGGLVAVDC